MRTDSAARAAALVLALASAACREAPLPPVESGRVARARTDADRSLLALLPPEAPAGELFQEQPVATAGLALLGTGFTPDDEVCWDGRPLPTTFAHTRLLTATVPGEYLTAPGTVEVSVESPADPSRRVTATFRLLPARTRP